MTPEQLRALAQQAARAQQLAGQPDLRELARMAAAQAASQPSLGQRLRDNLMGDDDPTTQNTGERIGTFLNKAGEAMTFGLVGDEASAAVEGIVPGVNYETRRDHYRDQEAILERDNVGLALGAELGGAVAGIATPAGAIGTLARGAGLLPRIGASVAAGAGMGGVTGAMEGEGLQSRMDGAQTGAAWGAGAGFVAPLAGSAFRRIMDARAGRKAIAQAAKGAPSSDELRQAGRAAYDQIDAAGVQIRPEAFDRARQGILDNLRTSTGFDELPGPGSLTPNTARVSQIMGEASDRMAAEPTAALPFRAVDQMRRQAGAAAGNVTNKSDQQAGMTVIEGLDDMVNRLGPDDVVAGDVEALQTLIPKARDLWGRMSRSQLVDDAMAQEGNYLSGGSSAIRNQFSRILKSPRLSRGFSEAEKTAMRRVVQGTVPEQILNLMGGGLGQLGQVGAGGLVGGFPGMAVGAGVAAGSRKLSEAVTRRNAETARAAIASGQLRQPLPVSSALQQLLLESAVRRTGAALPH